jgi:iron-sulfur cluster assembly accessory protein
MVSISQRAIDKVREFASQTPEAEGKELRLFIQGVGCGGFAYGFTFDDRREGDTVVEEGDFTMLVDQHSAPHLDGASVDFVDDERGTGFTVDNPNAPDPEAMGGCGSGGCGCG